MGRVVVVTHRAPEDAANRWPRTTFVDGVEAAITEARQIAGDQDVTIASAKITRQALDLGLVVVQGRRALHLRYPVRR